MFMSDYNLPGYDAMVYSRHSNVKSLKDKIKYLFNKTILFLFNLSPFCKLHKMSRQSNNCIVAGCLPLQSNIRQIPPAQCLEPMRPGCLVHTVVGCMSQRWI